MSGIAGILHLDGRPVEPRDLRRMTAAMAHRGPDGVGHWTNGAVGLAHATLWTTPEAVGEQQPAAGADGELRLTFHGRLDNRAELAAGLGVEPAALRTSSDAQLVLAAYARWREGCPEELLGDFAFALWDARRSLLLCARDALGLKPFFYFHREGRFVFASEPRAIVDLPAVRTEPNPGMIGELLANNVQSREETLFRGVLRLLPGHALVVRPGVSGPTVRRYWSFDPFRQVRYRRDEDYAGHLRELLREAVRCRMRCQARVGAELSGGLDSSSVVGMAETLRREGTVGGGLETYALVFPGSACDESRYIRQVVDRWGVVCHRFDPGAFAEVHSYADHVDLHRELPFYPNGSMSDPLKTHAAENGVRVLLTGLGGDDWLTGSLFHYADDLRRGRLLRFLRQAWLDTRVVDTVAFPRWRLLRRGVLPLVPAGAKRVLRRLFRRPAVYRPPAWLEPAFAQEIDLGRRLTAPIDWRRFSSFSQAALFSAGTGGWAVHGAEMEERSTSRFGLEQRHPFHDRRLVEFALALPEEQRWRGTWTKFVLRRAVRDLLPTGVLERRDKVEFSEMVPRALAAVGGRHVVEDLALCELGWVRQTEVLRMYDRMVSLFARRDPAYSPLAWSLWMIYAVDLWYSIAGSCRPAEATRRPRGSARGGK